MNRKFKFRVWDINSSSFLKERWDGISFFHNEIWRGVDFFMNRDGFVVQQYIGLNDKNDKEMYDGDIIQLEGAPYTYLIVWDVWKWGIRLTDESIQGMTSAVYDRSIVIGNIFKNPELFKSL